MCVNRCGCSNNNCGCGCNNGCGCPGNSNTCGNMASVSATMFNNDNNAEFTNNSMIASNGIGVDNLMYGHAYVPNQTLSTIFSAGQGLNYGTMFPELVSSYTPNQSLRTINYLRYNNTGGCCR